MSRSIKTEACLEVLYRETYSACQRCRARVGEELYLNVARTTVTNKRLRSSGHEKKSRLSFSGEYSLEENSGGPQSAGELEGSGYQLENDTNHAEYSIYTDVEHGPLGGIWESALQGASARLLEIHIRIR
jgi:hypothetical protein